MEAQHVEHADGWDGYPSYRAEMLGHLASNDVKNVVAITGDLHAFQCGVIYDSNDPRSGKPVAVDFVSAGISSSSFYQYLRAGAGSTPLAPLAEMLLSEMPNAVEVPPMVLTRTGPVDAPAATVTLMPVPLVKTSGP